MSSIVQLSLFQTSLNRMELTLNFTNKKKKKNMVLDAFIFASDDVDI